MSSEPNKSDERLREGPEVGAVFPDDGGSKIIMKILLIQDFWLLFSLILIYVRCAW